MSTFKIIFGIISGLVVLFVGLFILLGLFLLYDPNKPTMTTTIEIKRDIIEGEEEDEDKP